MMAGCIEAFASIAGNQAQTENRRGGSHWEKQSVDNSVRTLRSTEVGGPQAYLWWDQGRETALWNEAHLVGCSSISINWAR